MSANAITLERQRIACHVCSSERSVTYLEVRGYTVVQCLECGLWYVNPLPSVEELEQIYAGFDQGDQWRITEAHYYRGIRRHILRFKKRGRILDVGAGSGDFLRTMRAAGFDVQGIEPSRTGSEYARRQHGLDVFSGTVEQFLARSRAARFDVVTVLNVLEHLRDPAATLAQVREVLAEDGILVIVVPDARLHDVVGKARKALGLADPYLLRPEQALEGNQTDHPLVGFDPPFHLCSFSPQTIARLLTRCGYRPVYFRPAPPIFNRNKLKNVAKVAVTAFSRSLQALSLGSVLLGYTTLVIGTAGGGLPPRESKG